MVQIDFTGKAIMITGGLGAIAKHISGRLIESGAHMIITDIVPPDQAKQKLISWNLPSSHWTYFQMDTTDPVDLSRVGKEVFEDHPGLDIVLGHAGGCAMHTFAATSQAEYERIYEYNYLGQTRLTRFVLVEWLKRRTAGHMIFTSSLVANLPWPDLSAYCPAKAALETFAKCLALENAKHSIRFNCIAPGHVAAGSSLKVYEEDSEYREMVNRAIPMGRQVRPQAIGDAFLWLASPLAQDVNGQVIRVDCGASIPKVG